MMGVAMSDLLTGEHRRIQGEMQSSHLDLEETCSALSFLATSLIQDKLKTMHSHKIIVC